MAFVNLLCARSFSTSVGLFIKNVTIIGGGLMGAGIAQVAAQSGHEVTLVDVSNEVLKKSTDNISASLSRVAKKKFEGNKEAGDTFVKETLNRIKTCASAEDGVQESDLVIEAIIENLEIKQKLFANLDKVAPPYTLFASNTSSLPVSEIAALTQRKDRFGGLHFFNPVPVMQLLEVIRIKETSDETYKQFMEFGKNLRKICITCKDTPGFVVNRLLKPHMNESLRMLERGDATAEDIDNGVKFGLGYPMGPFELMDYVGLDTHYYVATAWGKRFPNDTSYVVSPIVEKLVKEGKFGRKTGEGFYKYNKK
ncbi:hypothetical protein CHUAL_013323 [Chamberlinius hualienensis]